MKKIAEIHEGEELELDIPYKEGYDFVGWAKEANSSDTFTTLPTTCEGEVVLFAIWAKAGAKTVTFDFNGEKKEYEVVDHKNIWHHGKSTERPVIELDIKFHNTIYKSEKVNLKISDLTGTKHYRCRMLLSKQFMSRANIVIDPSKTFELTDKKEKKKKKDKNA